ncbi:hypothetical protein [Sphingomonas alpina]|uniref:Uncharacterized protein n=1 Tax=Sphingomonas alpina TaxID=653931 RepID=A0A7H0LM50_9SPHN|nr:hypothetical protein [Sphingomonas alpina]QNQ10753.1 hypothetical protein H3Z74_06055 [Sphingomonas alpina]
MIVIALLALLVAGTADKQPKQAPPPPPPVSVDGLPIGGLPQQVLPATGCAAFLWSVGQTRAMVAMASAEPASVRLSIDGQQIDVPRTAQQGAGGFGFSSVTEYEGSGVKAVLDMTIATRGDLKDGATVPEATLRIERSGKDSIILPVMGLIGCV